MIPKVIHYCWFGHNEMPEKAKECIESWKKYFPDYEIKEWNEDNFPIEQCAYTKEAYAAKKWAFVSDYARFKILYENGGIYLDTDVEVVKPFDNLLVNKAFMGFEDGKPGLSNNIYMVNPGLGLAAEKGLGFFKEILDYYAELHFTTEDGSQLMTTIVDHTTSMLRKKGLVNENKIQSIEDITIYPSDYFCPLNFNTGKLNMTDNTYSIHHFVASWFTPLDWVILKIERRFSGKGKVMFILGRILMLPFRLIRKVKNIGVVGTINLLLKKRGINQNEK